MEKEGYKENEALDREIAEYEAKLAEMKKGYDYTIHQFAKGIFYIYKRH